VRKSAQVATTILREETIYKASMKNSVKKARRKENAEVLQPEERSGQ
jgi:hypothetical protein